MNGNLQMKEDKGIFKKIKSFFRNLFCKNDLTENKNEEVEKTTQKENFSDSIKVEVDNEFQKEIEANNLVEKIRENPEIIKTLSNEQLEELDKHYDKLIERNKQIIELKKAKLAKLKNSNK